MKAAMLCIALAACDWSLHRMQEPVGCVVHGTTDLLPNGACDLVPPEGAIAMTAPAQPPPVTRDLLVRGRDRFERFCAPCHGLLADGNSYVARAMKLRKPPSLVDAAARKLDDGRIFTVITSGYGLMPSYASALAPRDRFAILHYVHALQQRDVALAELPPAQREEAMRWLR